jgi:hypothetical protein
MFGGRISLRILRPTWGQILVSLSIATLGILGGEALSQVDQDLRIMYTEYTLAATDLAHISADVIRYRTSVVRALEAPSQKEFEKITRSLPERHARIQHAVDRYAAASLRVSRSGRSEPQDIQAVRESLDAYFSAASRTINLLTQVWIARSPQDAAELRHQAELQAADNAGPKMIQVSLALDRLLETVADVAKDMRDEGTRTIRDTSSTLLIGSFVIAFLNLFAGRRRPPPHDPSPNVHTVSEEGPTFALPLERPDAHLPRT